MRSAFAVSLFSLGLFCCGHAAAANTWGTDLSDLWWNPNESGWGVNFAHQQEIIFMTLFVYGADNKAKWYVASALASQGGANTYTFTGPLYETTGPYFGAATFNPDNVVARPVGTATATFPLIDQGTLTYTVDGVAVTKAIQRQTFRNNNLAGSYVGASIGSTAGCAGGGPFENSALLAVTQTGSAISITITIGSGASCTYSGTYAQQGRMGDIVGNLACSNGARGTFDAFEIEASYVGFFARYTADYGGGCTEAGRIGGIKR